jgi:hypothetical protein
VKDWFWNVLLGLDQFGNTIIGGHPDETISSRLGRRKLRAAFSNDTWPWFCRWLDGFLDWADPRGGSHALNAIEDRAIIERAVAEGAKLVFDHSGRIVDFVFERDA